MRVSRRIGVGDPLPATSVAEVVGGDLRILQLDKIFALQRVILIGVPGAFTPICSRIHLPKFVQDGPALLRSGFDQIACIAPDNPWAVEAWASQVDPERAIRFLSDGNLTFGRAAGLTTSIPNVFVGEGFERFVLIVNNGVVEKISVERSVFEVDCTASDRCLAAA